MLAAGKTWYKSKMLRNEITKITLKDTYAPTGTEDETWNADVNDTGDIKGYRIGTEVIIAGNGSGKIMANYSMQFNAGPSVDNGFIEEIPSSVTEIDLGILDTSQVTYMSGMFSGFVDLTSLDVSHFDTSNVTDMSMMFEGCKNLRQLDVSNFDTSKVTNMFVMFSGCTFLKELDLSKWNTSNVTSMNNMFNSCRSLRTIYAGDGWNTDNVENSDSMFSNCTNLRGRIPFNKHYTNKTYAKTSNGYLTYKQA